MDKTLTAYGLSHNPFSSDLPPDAYPQSKTVAHFAERTVRLARDGGYALVTGDPGLGKSTVLRQIVAQHARKADVRVGELTRPQATVADFYRELGDLFGVPLTPHNRWAGIKVLRERWQEHLDTALYRPVLVVDEAQEMRPTVLNEIRLLASSRLDSHILITVVIAGDHRLVDKLSTPELAALLSRMRVRLTLEPLAPAELRDRLTGLLHWAGNPALMTRELVETLCERACGNLRTLIYLCAELLEAGAERGAARLDEKLYLELFATPESANGRAPRGGRRGR